MPFYAYFCAANCCVVLNYLIFVGLLMQLSKKCIMSLKLLFFVVVEIIDSSNIFPETATDS